MEPYQISTGLPVEGYCESHIGGRSENQDSYGYQDTPFGLLVTVCDGMGGGPAGKMASSLAVGEILAGVMENAEDNAPKEVLLQAIQRANQAILNAVEDNPELKGMGTTCTALLINKESAIVAHVGDSRVYQLRGHRKVFRTFDHSVVFEMVKQKIITEEQARLSEQSNLITRALGIKAELEIDVEERPYRKGDRFMLCSDGIHGTMPETELIQKATRQGSLDQTVDDIAKFVDNQGRKNGGGHDNLTLAILETKNHSKLKEKIKNKTTIILGGIAIILAVMALLLNSCQNKDIDIDSFSISEEQLRPGYDTVYIEGSYDFFEEVESMKLNIGRDSTLSDARSHVVALEGRNFSVTVKNLQPATTYYYKYSANIGLSKDFLSRTKHFTTARVKQYAITVASNPVQGSVSGGGLYDEGQICTVRAKNNEGYVFVDWSENGMEVSTDSIYSFTVNKNRFLDANFISQQSCIVRLITNPSQGTVTGAGAYVYGQQCTVTAIANEGYVFINWTENGEVVSTDAVYTFMVTGNRELEANFCYSGGGNTIPDGIIEGKFSVSTTQKVYFSQGNLQYKASTNTWRFAENQYDCVGIANNNISQYYNDWIDLFGWGTSGFPHGATCYLPYSTSQRYYDYYVYGSSSYNLYDQTGLGDWGANPISNGGNQACIWRTLSKNEWVYLLQTRNTSSGLRYAKAMVAGKNGVILLPDNWNTSTYTLQNANNNNASFNSNVISSSDWNSLQSAGAVFLPAAGSRTGISVSGTDANGYYWSSIYYDDYYACMLSFSNTALTPYQNDYRYYGQSVRLVYEIKE